MNLPSRSEMHCPSMERFSPVVSFWQEPIHTTGIDISTTFNIFRARLLASPPPIPLLKHQISPVQKTPTFLYDMHLLFIDTVLGCYDELARHMEISIPIVFHRFTQEIPFLSLQVWCFMHSPQRTAVIFLTRSSRTHEYAIFSATQI